jgi:sugar lactone lactonase YvrE
MDLNARKSNVMLSRFILLLAITVSPSLVACKIEAETQQPSSNTVITTSIPINEPGVLSLIAGNLDGPGTTDGPVKIAQFGDGHTSYGNRPTGIVSDAVGNLYVADVSNHTIRKISRDGVVTTIAGKAETAGNIDGKGGEARFNFPSGIAIDAKGTLYIADSSNDAIRKISPDGVVTTLAKLTPAKSVDGRDLPPARVEIKMDSASSGGPFNLQDVQSQSPMGIAVDTQGQVYVANTFNSTILKINPEGIITTIAGQPRSTVGHVDGAGSAAWFNLPKGIAVDKSGSLYVADCGNNAIRKITPAGVVTTIIGKPATQESDFNCPTGITLDTNGNLYVADEGSETIRKINAKGVVSTLAGAVRERGYADGQGATAKFNAPTGVTIDKAGSIYVTDSRNASIRKISPTGDVITMAGRVRHDGNADGIGAAAQFSHPFALTADKRGNLFVADTGNETVRKIYPNGKVVTAPVDSEKSKGPDVTALFESIFDIKLDAMGNFYIVNSRINVIRKINENGFTNTFAGAYKKAGNTDGAGLLARFNEPYAIAFDQVGNLYVTDNNNHTIRKIDSNGQVVTFAGRSGEQGHVDGIGKDAKFSWPVGIATDRSGNVYVTSNDTIRKINPIGMVTTLAGRAGQSGSADGIGEAALFSSPASLVVDPSGNVYVCDYGNSTIRKITPNGVVTTIAGIAGKPGLVLGLGGRLDEPRGLTLIDSKTLALTSGNAILKLVLP